MPLHLVQHLELHLEFKICWRVADPNRAHTSVGQLQDYVTPALAMPEPIDTQFVAPAGWDDAHGQQTGPLKPPDTGASWGHWKGDGLYGKGDLPSPVSPLRESKRPVSPRPSSPSSTMSGVSTSSGRPMSTSPMDGAGFDRTYGVPAKEATKVWSQRSMPQMADHGTIPSGLPLGLTDSEKKLWRTRRTHGPHPESPRPHPCFSCTPASPITSCPVQSPSTSRRASSSTTTRGAR